MDRKMGGSMNRWAVRKLHPHVCGPDGTAWVAGEVGKWHNTVCSFRTYEEAMAYADKRARTREVVLPGPDWLTRHGVQLDADRYRTSAKANSLKYGIYIDIPTQDLRPLALALLAHAERMHE